MKKNSRAEIVSKVLLTVTVLVLAAMVLWFITLPEKDYEAVPNQIEHVALSETISQTGIYQTLKSNGRIRGIRVRWATGKNAPEDGVIADLMDPDKGVFLERVIVPGSDIKDNTESEIVFPGRYEAGNYLVKLSLLPDSQDTIGVWESANDSYKDGAAYNSRNEDEGRDWSFNVLVSLPDSLLARHRAEKIIYTVLTAMAGAGALIWIFGEKQLRKRKRIASIIRFAGKHSDQILIFLLVLIPTLTYLDFLTGERLYVFTMLDRGADSVGQTYPGLLNTAARVRNGLWGELFNFQQGLGDAESAFFPTVTNWVSLFGESMVARLMGFSQWAKVVLSGIFAFMFAREYGAGAAARFMIALGYAFNSMLIARGAWESYPNIAMLAILWLYAYERRLNGKGKLLSLFATLFMFINLGLYDCVFYAVLLPGYMLIRRIIKEKTGKEIFRAFFRDLWPFAVFAFFGMMDTVRYLLARTLSSSRLQEGMEGYEEAVSGFFSAPDIWISAFLRTIGHSISGITWQTGSLNLLEGPAFYTGISVMLAAPAALWCMKGKQKATYLVLVFGAACYIAIVPLRLIASGFAKETFKLSSFWIVIAMLLFAADIFRRAKKHELRRGTMAVLMISALAMIGLLIFSRASGYVASVNEWWISLAFVILYLILGTLFCTGTRTGLIRLLAILCVIAEAALVPFEMVHNREMESADENSMKERAATKEIIAALPGDEWYRMEKDYVNVFQSDSLAEGYKGSSSYLGGIEINQSVLDIYQEFTLPQRSNHYLFGSGGNIYFEATEACRYLLAKNNFEFRYGYELKGERNGIKIYENLYAHPFVYYSKDLTDPETLRGEYESSDKVGYEVRSNAVRFGLLPENTVLIIEAEFDHQSRCTLYMEDRNNRFSSVYFMGSRHMVFEIANPEIQSMWFDTNTRKRLKDIHFYAVDQEEYYQAFRERSAEAQKNAVQIRSEGENHFTGEVQAEEDGYIITAIPYDKKWVICLDEKILDTMVVNGGFLGAEIPKGEYQLQIRYAGDSWLTGNLFKILGFGAFIFAAVMIKFQNKNRKERIS